MVVGDCTSELCLEEEDTFLDGVVVLTGFVAQVQRFDLRDEGE